MKKYMKPLKENYDNLHSTVYACIHAGEEFKRRFLDTYEEKKIKGNGDINV